jgi:glycerophosphoryl diester phosphodiesterase
MSDKIEIYAHRGGAGLMPETTLAAYQNALALGVDVLDMDVGVTKDNIIVAYHDRTLNRDYTRYQDGRPLPQKPLFLKDFTFEELQQFDVGILDKTSPYGKNFPDQHSVPGEKILSLEQVLQYGKKIAGNKIRFQIEIKTDPRYPNTTASPEKFAELIAEIINTENKHDQIEVHSFDWRNLLLLQKIDSRICTSFITSKAENRIHFLTSPFTYPRWFADYKVRHYKHSWPKLISSLRGKIWCPDFKDVTPENVAEAHSYDLRVVPWTVDTNKNLDKIIACQVDGIITNRPDLLRNRLQLQNHTLPEGFTLQPRSSQY